MWFYFPDIDIAVDRPPAEGDFEKDKADYAEISVSRNHYNGFKLESADFGAIDIWSWATSRCDLDEVILHRQLAEVDFGVNAVAFLWPQKKIVLHENWLEDTEYRRIEKLSRHSLRPAIAPLRAVALAVKMSRVSGQSFHIGRHIRDDLCTVVVKDAGAMEECLSYMQKKVALGRWPEAVRRRFAGEIKRARKRET